MYMTSVKFLDSMNGIISYQINIHDLLWSHDQCCSIEDTMHRQQVKIIRKRSSYDLHQKKHINTLKCHHTWPLMLFYDFSSILFKTLIVLEHNLLSNYVMTCQILVRNQRVHGRNSTISKHNLTRHNHFGFKCHDLIGQVHGLVTHPSNIPDW